LPRIVWCLLNPSTATASASDPTLARVLGFSRRWGAGAVEIVNLFALRTPNPKDLTTTLIDPVGGRNDEAITMAAQETNEVVAAWGTNGRLANPETRKARSDEVLELLSNSEARLLHLRLTKNGQPGHPLYVPMVRVGWRMQPGDRLLVLSGELVGELRWASSDLLKELAVPERLVEFPST